MTDFIQKAILEKKLGLALHYPLIYAATVGIVKANTFEFGAGGSTRVFLEAQTISGGAHHSVSTDSFEDISEIVYGSGIETASHNWHHQQLTLSEENRSYLDRPDPELPNARFDIALHDGAHDAETVKGDIAWIWPKIKIGGLLLVHDVEHELCGEAVRSGLNAGLRSAEASFSITYLPYGFGLAVVRKEGETPEIMPAEAKKNGARTVFAPPFFTCHFRGR